MKLETEFYTRNGAVYDKDGRFRIFRGFSVHDELSVTASEADADAFFSRVAELGGTLLFWNVPWAAVEPSAPDEYDEAYLAGLRRLLKQAESYALRFVLEPSFSRAGASDFVSGIPSWIPDLIGLDTDSVPKADAAAVSVGSQRAGTAANRPLYAAPDLSAYAPATVNTLFWGAADFAPAVHAEGEAVSEYLQAHYIAAMKHTARRLKDCESVIGFGCMADAHPGYIGTEDPARFAAAFSDCLSAPVWKPGFDCPWKSAGVWHEAGGAVVFDMPDYFNTRRGAPVRFAEDFLKPFQKRFMAALEKKHDQYLFFPEAAVTGERPQWRIFENPALLPDRAVEKEGGVLAEGDRETLKMILPFAFQAFSAAPPVSDPAAEITGTGTAAAGKPLPFLVTGVCPSEPCARAVLANTVSFIKNAAASLFGKRSGAEPDARAALDEPLISYLYASVSDSADALDGAGLIRPYACAVNGTPLGSSFRSEPVAVFEFEWHALPQQSGSGTAGATELVIPSVWYPSGWKVESFDGVGTLTCAPERQRLYVTTLSERKCRIRIVPA